MEGGIVSTSRLFYGDILVGHTEREKDKERASENQENLLDSLSLELPESGEEKEEEVEASVRAPIKLLRFFKGASGSSGPRKSFAGL